MNIAPASAPRAQQILSFLESSGWDRAELHPLAGDASFRRYIRVRKEGRSAMLMDAPPEKENSRSYLTVARYLHGHGYSVPRILAERAQDGLLLLEDLGDDLFSACMRCDPSCENTLYEAAIDVLVDWHGRCRRADGASIAAYTSALLTQEAALLSDWFLPQTLGIDRASALRAEYLEIWDRVLSAAPLLSDSFVHRDYHADNLMWLREREGVQRVGLLDFQDAVYGDPAYDMVSLLEDARRDVPAPVVEAMLARYLDRTGVDRARFMTAYAVLGAQRNSKIVGIFTRLAARDGKRQYLPLLPRVWGYLARDLAHPALSDLRAWMDLHVSPEDRGVIAIQHDSRELMLTA